MTEEEKKVPMFVSPPQTFSANGYGRLVLRDLNEIIRRENVKILNKTTLQKYLREPASNEKELRDASNYIYDASTHYRRLIQYFAGLTDLSYVVSPSRVDTAKAKPSTVRNQYRKVLSTLNNMNIKSQFENVILTCLKTDTYFGTMHISSDSIVLQQLNPDYCDIAVIEDNVLNVSFDFSYFDKDESVLSMYPEEFKRKYNIYKKDKKKKWQELDAPTSFAIKSNKEVLSYSIPPFIGILREVYDLEDYKQLKMTKTELENYAMLVMKLGLDKDGNYAIDYETARDFWQNLDGVLPEEVGSVLSPMEVEKISFDRAHTGDTNTIAEAERNLFTSAGVSSLLFNNEKASSNALLLSIKVDQALTYSIVKSIEDAINRFIQRQNYGRNFKVTFLDCSPFNRKEMGDQYLKACQLGLPMVSYYCASQGMLQYEMDTMNFLEDDVLNIKDKFIPLRSSSTMSGDSGRPTKDVGELSDNGEVSTERGER